MPIQSGLNLNQVARLIPSGVNAYNDSKNGPRYNKSYKEYIEARDVGMSSVGSLAKWLIGGSSIVAIAELLTVYGMNARKSKLVSPDILIRTFSALEPSSLDWISELSLPLKKEPAKTIRPHTGKTLSEELSKIYDILSARGGITESGGYVVASKTAHCLFPKLVPMIDGSHSGVSYYNIRRESYVPPMGLVDWGEWIGHKLSGQPNPSPLGAGRQGWCADQFLAAIGVNQHIYEIWQAANNSPGLQAFLLLDPEEGTTGIPRLIDKVLW